MMAFIPGNITAVSGIASTSAVGMALWHYVGNIMTGCTHMTALSTHNSHRTHDTCTIK